MVRENGGNILDDVYYVKSEFLPFKKATEEEKKGADEWFERILPKLR